MKLAVFGATGGIGTQVVTRALADGHQVSAVVRDRSRLAVPDQAGLDVTVAGFGDIDALAGAIGGADVVVSALYGADEVCQKGARAAVTAMRATGVHRLLVVSASALHTVPNDGLAMRALLKPVLRLVLRKHYADLTVMEDVVKTSGLDWTIVCPPRLTDGPHTGKIWHRAGDAERHGQALSRADVADFLLRTAAATDRSSETIFIGQE